MYVIFEQRERDARRGLRGRSLGQLLPRAGRTAHVSRGDGQARRQFMARAAGRPDEAGEPTDVRPAAPSSPRRRARQASRVFLYELARRQLLVEDAVRRGK